MEDRVLDLQSFGLTAYESKIYMALVGQISLTIKELVIQAKIPRTKCYENLRSLEDQGWISKQSGRPTLYMAKDPKLIFQKLHEEYKSKIAETISFLSAKWDNRDLMQTESVSVIVGSDYIRNETLAAIKRAKNSIFMVIRFLIPKELEKLVKVLQSAKKNGIHIQIILSSEIYPQLDNNEKELLKSLEVVKLGPVPVRVIIIDQKWVMLSFVSVKEDKIQFERSQTIIISYENFTGMMQQSLNMSWESFSQI